ncbi:tetratricopeptide repeat protein [Patescibacteria group bacterium]|nr:tetratricopeptide repeat protein [Patescibacteria group bacterium]MBU1868347.1 tetratricopeptide repeat protein [Patescibacteria group bacterium]
MKNEGQLQTTNSLVINADNFRNRGETEKAIQLYRKSIGFYEKLPNQSRQIANCMQMIGVCHKIENRTEDAIQWLQKASNLYNEINDYIGAGNSLRDIGITYLYIKNYEQALVFLRESEQILAKTEDKVAYGITISKIGLLYTQIGQFDKAEEFLKRGLTIIRSVGNWFMEMTTLLHLAELAYQQQNYQKILSYTNQSLEIINNNNQQEKQQRRLAQIHGLLALGYLNLGDKQAALQHYQKVAPLIAHLTTEGKNVVLADIRADQLEKQFQTN